MGRAGVSGSIDLGAAALIYSFTGNSNIRVPIARLDDALGGIQLHVTNQIGIAETADGVEIGDFELDYDLTNGVYRNGGYVTGAIGDSGWGWRLYGHDTRWSGDDLFVDAHAELGVALLSLADAAGFPYEALSLSAGYLGDFEDYEGVQFMVRGRF